MLQIYFIKKNRNLVLKNLKKRNFKNINIIDEILSIDSDRKTIQNYINNLLKEKKIIFKNINFNYKKDEKISKSNIVKLTELKIKIKNLKKKLIFLNESLEKKLIDIPNITNKNISIFKNNNKIYNKELILNDNKNITHWELSNKNKIIDFKIGSKISGTGFPVYSGKLALLQRGLIRYFLDYNIKNGYNEYILPYLVNEKSCYCTGQLPDKEGQMYYINKNNLYLIPTGEIPLLNCYRDKTLLVNDLPIKSTTYTSCFRRESGSYGTSVRGLNRIHQFDKVEIIQITTCENSHNALKNMINHVKNLLLTLKLPFRILKLRDDETGFSSAMTYDFEVYSLAQKKWLEVSSISNCTDFQSIRLNLKYKMENKKVMFCHTLNGSSLALPRILISILENNQNSNLIRMPNVLVPYIGFENISIS